MWLGLITNMFLEETNKKIKYCYMDAKQNRKMDECIGFSRALLKGHDVRQNDKNDEKQYNVWDKTNSS